MKCKFGRMVLLLAGLASAVSCTKSEELTLEELKQPAQTSTVAATRDSALPATATTRVEKVTAVSRVHPLVVAARQQIGKTLRYDPTYTKIGYPNGDVALEKGVCTDVVIRGLRTAWHMDLQRLVHEDMKRAFGQYPKQWGLRAPDANIDHRRVPNLQRYFERQGFALGVTREVKDYLPGDLVTCKVGGTLPHIMVVSDQKNAQGVPLVIHNIGQGTKEEDCLMMYPLTGHYRISVKP